MRQYPAPSVERSTPIKLGTEIALSEQILPAWSELIIAGKVNRFNASDFTSSQFQRLSNREFIQQVIPDLKRYGEQLECNVEFLLIEPIQLANAPQSTQPSPEDKPQPPNGFVLSLPNLRTSISTRQPGEKHWTPRVEVDLKIRRGYAASLIHGNFAARAVG